VSNPTHTGPQAQEAGISELLAQEIRRVDGNHSLGAAALADALMPFITSQTPARVVSDDRLLRIGELIRTQDNRITSHPIFVVEEVETVYGVDPQYDGILAWVDGDGQVPDEEAAELEAGYQDGNPIPKGYTRTGYVERWRFVTACFTEEGCKDYLRSNGHNLRRPRIYVHSGWRNAEWIELRAALSTLQSGAEGKDGDANLCRQWFDALQDVHPKYLVLQDYELAARLYMQCGMRIPNGIGSKLDAAKDTALQPGQGGE
jgi:hypothetical protein